MPWALEFVPAFLAELALLHERHEDAQKRDPLHLSRCLLVKSRGEVLLRVHPRGRTGFGILGSFFSVDRLPV